MSDGNIFRTSERVIRQQTHSRDVRKSAEKTSRRLHFLLRIIESGDDRHPDFNRLARLRKTAQVFQNPLIPDSCAGFVRFRIHLFQIIQKQIRERKDCFKCTPRNFTASICRAGYALPVQKPEELRAELRMQQRLAAGNRHASTALSIEDAVGKKLRHQFLRRNGASVKHKRIVQTRIHALSAADAARAVECVHTVFHMVTRTDCGAGTAFHAFCKNRQLRSGTLRLRIVAPQTTQRTALQKNRCPDSGSVVHGEMFDVNDPCGIHCCASACAINAFCSSWERLTNLLFQPQTRTWTSSYFSGSSCAFLRSSAFRMLN